MTVTKAQLIERVISLGVSERVAKQAVQLVIDSIAQALKENKKAQITGFGSFHIKTRGARVGRNPKTGAVVNIAPKKVPVFKPSEEFKEAVR